MSALLEVRRLIARATRDGGGKPDVVFAGPQLHAALLEEFKSNARFAPGPRAFESLLFVDDVIVSVELPSATILPEGERPTTHEPRRRDWCTGTFFMAWEDIPLDVRGTRR